MVFLDTEFIDGPSPVLLSLGMVYKDKEFYVELDLDGPCTSIDTMNDFLVNHVLSKWGAIPGASAGRDVMAGKAALWLERLSLDVVPVVYDYSTDFGLLENLISVLSSPLRIRLEPIHVGYLLEDLDGEAAADAAWMASADRGLGKHHALADALALKARFEAVHGR
jgi:hypothetical protein